jgi:EmrB/QacA subfamily drug resistance transporter
MSTLSPPQRAVLALLALAQLMVILDISAVNVALPDLSRDLGIARGDLEWTITSYSLLFGSLLLLGGRAADLLGRRRTFLAGLILFVTASLAAALAPSAGALYAARASQGVGAALLSPAALSIITTTFASARERAVALGVWGAVGGTGAAAGVLLGGVLTDWLGWRAIFFINVPLGVLLAVGVLRAVRPDPTPARGRGLDLRGALVGTASLAVLLYALAGADDVGWAAPRTLALGGIALAGLAAFAALESRAARPLLRVDALADRAVGGGSALMLLAAAVLMGSFLLTSVYLQEVLDVSPLQAGLAFLPIALATAVGAHAGSHAVRRAGVRAPMAVAFALAAGGMLLLSRVDGGGSYAVGVLPGMLIAGVGLGLAMVCVAVAVLTGARQDDAGMLSGLNTTGHEVGGALGVAALATVAAGADPLAAGIGNAFLAAAAVAGAGVPLALVLLPGAGRFLRRMQHSPQAVSIH